MNFKRYLEKIRKKTEKTQSKFEDETTVSENNITDQEIQPEVKAVSYTHLRAHET